MSQENGVNRTRLQRDCVSMLAHVDSWAWPHRDIAHLMDKIGMHPTHRTMFRDRALLVLGKDSSFWESWPTTTATKVRTLIFVISRGAGNPVQTPPKIPKAVRHEVGVLA